MTKMKFDINAYRGKYAMHCKTKEEARVFCNYLHSIGRKWCNGDSYLEKTDYDFYKDNTIYYFNEGCYGLLSNAVKKDYTILEWSDFMEFSKSDLQTGDVIQRRNGNVEIANPYLGMLICPNGWNNLDDILEDLTSARNKEFDIVAVRRPKVKADCQFKAFEMKWGTLVYERKEPEEMTLAEVCRLLGKEIKIVK